MASTDTVRKETGLRPGDAATIARIHRVSRHHVNEVAKGNRTGRPALLKTIEQYRDRNAQPSA